MPGYEDRVRTPLSEASVLRPENWRRVLLSAVATPAEGPSSSGPKRAAYAPYGRAFECEMLTR